LTFSSAGQDAAVVNPKIVKVEFENQQVRILRARYAPHERLEIALSSDEGRSIDH
jgi:hypothetical protein